MGRRKLSRGQAETRARKRNRLARWELVNPFRRHGLQRSCGASEDRRRAGVTVDGTDVEGYVPLPFGNADSTWEDGVGVGVSLSSRLIGFSAACMFLLGPASACTEIRPASSPYPPTTADVLPPRVLGTAVTLVVPPRSFPQASEAAGRAADELAVRLGLDAEAKACAAAFLDAHPEVLEGDVAVAMSGPGGCQHSTVMARQFAVEVAAQYGGLVSDAELGCLRDGYASLDQEVLAEAIRGAVSPGGTAAPSDVLDDLRLRCTGRDVPSGRP